ncbi:MAG: hydrogenase maturation protease [Streptosporangiales bacterium]
MPEGRRVLVAGIGNVFRGDDGFGSAVARRLERESFPDGVEVADYGIRGVHLAYQLLEGYDLLVLIDAVPRGGPPGTVYVIEPDQVTDDAAETAPMDSHDMSPELVLGLLPKLGGSIDRVLVVGCEPATVDDGMVLSAPVEGAIEEAAATVLDIVAGALSEELAP